MVPAPGAYNIFTAVDKAIHRHKRKVISQGFSDQCIRDFEPTILSHVDLFLKRLCTSKDPSTGADWSSPFNMTDCCRHLGYDIMGEFGFGQTFHLQTSDENRFLIDAVTATSHKAGVYVQYPELQKLRLEALFYRRGLEMRRKYLELMSNLVKNRLAAGKSSRNDLFSFIVDAKDPETGVGFSEDELWAESRFLLIAGAFTGSSDTEMSLMTTVSRCRHILYSSYVFVLLPRSLSRVLSEAYRRSALDIRHPLRDSLGPGAFILPVPPSLFG
ncbi:Cytochrome P450 [Macrophomina phaseolina MS6]|uniref:Cytochrome P450 n=1 Tax=Macrophomina phaseolina (strain MS6) TaxID=1126212 RepID=K2RPE7_MACPH|nr:Cytochrome P450 [Macrophomina phaseolina MS6]